MEKVNLGFELKAFAEIWELYFGFQFYSISLRKARETPMSTKSY